MKHILYKADRHALVLIHIIIFLSSVYHHHHHHHLTFLDGLTDLYDHFWT